MRPGGPFLALALLLAWQSPALAEEPAPADLTDQKAMVDSFKEMIESFPTVDLGQIVNEKEFDTSRPVVGIGFQVEGKTMRIVRVLDGSAADRAGLEVDMVVTRINGLRAGDFSMDELGRILAAIDGTITFEIEGRGEIGLVKAPVAPAAAG